MEKKEECKQVVPKWMVTFSDMTTLLLVFFVMLLSAGEVKKVKTFIILSAFEGKLGFFNGGLSLDEGEFERMGQTVESLPSNRRAAGLNQTVKDAISKMIMRQENNRYIRIDEQERGTVISLMTDVLFEDGTANLTLDDNTRQIIENMRYIIDNIGTDSKIAFEGHANDDEIRDPRYKDVWDLSVQRAWALLHAISVVPSVKPLNESNVSIRGFGSTLPLDDNSTPENKVFNRRVDIVITHDRF